MVNPRADYMEAGETRFNAYDKPFTCDLPYGRCVFPEDRFEASSTQHTIVNYGNHDVGSYGHRPHYVLTNYEDFYETKRDNTIPPYII